MERTTKEQRINAITEQIRETESKHSDTVRYAVWLEQQLYTSPTEPVFFERLARLKEVEDQRDELARRVCAMRGEVLSIQLDEIGGLYAESDL